MKKILLFLLAALTPGLSSCHAAPLPSETEAAPASPRVEYSLNNKGLSTFSVNGQSLLGYAWSGELKPVNHTPKIKKPDGTVSGDTAAPKRTFDKETNMVRHEYPWGVVTAKYSARPDGVAVEVGVTNSSAENTLQALDLQLAELLFKEVPQGRTLEAGMWGNGGGWSPLHSSPRVAPSSVMPPLILGRYEGGSLAFASHDIVSDSNGAATISVPFSTNAPAKTMYPFRVAFAPLAPEQSAASTVSLRFGASNATTDTLAGDILESYRAAYPITVEWADRRPIGALFLATSQAHPEKNPRGWFLNDKNTDVTTEEGLKKWREKVLHYADSSIKILKDIDAQGMILWDPEGEEFANATYYGDPRLTAKLAPETEYKGDSAIGTMDAYFKRFTDAGLRTGICIRPQEIKFHDGKPSQHEAADPLKEMLGKIEYAKKRWGCTLFYVDSTYAKKTGALDADMFKVIGQKHPDILLFPENESFRYFAYSAPLNSFSHHNVTSTPDSVREVYPQAFSGLLATGSKAQYDQHRDALIAAVRRGDILVVNSWYGGVHTEETKKIYAAAKATTELVK